MLGLVITGWRKSSYSAANGACVEAASGPSAVGVRDSKDPESPVLIFAAGSWRAFVTALKAGGVAH